MRMLSGFKIRMKKEELLKRLRANRETHAKIVAEARVGYVAKAKVELRRKLDKLESGKITSLAFRLSVPLDYTSVYDSAIVMFEIDLNDEIELTSEQVETLIRDRWDWTQAFYGSNKVYSATAAMIDGDEAGVDDDEI